MKMTTYKFMLFLLCLSLFTPLKADTNPHFPTSISTEDPCDAVSPSFSLPATLCQNYGDFSLTGNYGFNLLDPMRGGTFSLDGNALSSMSPAIPPSFNTNRLSLGNHTVSYTVRVRMNVIPVGGGAPIPIECTKTLTKTVEITLVNCPDPCDPIVPGFTLPATLCQNSGVFTLSGNYGSNIADPRTPSFFSLDGNTLVGPSPGASPSFNTNTLSLGDHTIEYTVATLLSPGLPSIPCRKSISKKVKIIAAVTPTISLNDKFCVRDNGYFLEGFGSPSGGSFTINGSPATEFNPRVLGVGSFTVVYTLSQDCGTKSATKVVMIEDLTASIDNLSSYYCISQTTSVNLSGTPAGGVFDLDGSLAASFNPSTLSVGSHTVRYFVVSPICTTSVSKTFDIVQPPAPSITDLNPDYCRGSSSVTLKGVPAGGVFTIDGLVNGSLTPDNWSVGSHTIGYTVNIGGCPSTAKTDVFIGSPTASSMIMGLEPSYCKGTGTTQLRGMPMGGTFTLDGTMAMYIDPSVLSLGMHTVLYTPMPNSCALPVTQKINIMGNEVTLSMTPIKPIYTTDDSPVALEGTPASGIFTIDGIQTSVLDPAQLAIGDHKLVFTVRTGECTNTLNKIVKIQANNLDLLNPTKCFSIVSKNDNKAISIETPLNNSPIVLQDYTQSSYQKWQFGLLSNGYFKINANESGHYLTARLGSRATSVFQNIYSRDGLKDWQVEKIGKTGYYRLVQRSSGKALSVLDPNLRNPFTLITWAGDDNQLFKINPLTCSNDNLDVPLLQSSKSTKSAAPLTAYPNPVKEELTVDLALKDSNGYKLELINTLGSRLFEKKGGNTEGDNQVKIPTSHLPNGTYILTLKTGSEVFNYKIIVNQ
jgi:hypothetical protein